MKIYVSICLLFVIILLPTSFLNGMTLGDPVLVLGAEELPGTTGKPYYKVHDLFRIKDMVISPDDKIYILASGSGSVSYYDMAGKCLGSIGRIGQGPEELYEPTNIEIVGRNLWVADFKNNRIQEFGISSAGLVHKRTIKQTKINMPFHLAVAGDKVLMSSTSIHPLTKGIGVFDFNGKFQQLLKIDPKIKTQRTLALWSMAKIVGLNDNRVLVGYKNLPLVVLLDKELKNQRIVDLSDYYSKYEDKRDSGYTLPAGYSATAFSSGPDSSILIAACDNKKKNCNKILRFDSQLKNQIGTLNYHKHVWEMKYYPEKKLLIFLNSNDEIAVYNVK
ncbi:MAG: hypothetical protein GY765_15390 [bacterium]|nr:hypothetical protein [bacterium]